MTNAIEATGLSKRYGATTALAGVDLSSGWGRVHGLLGPNGSGKTTMVRIFATLLGADAGAARVGGHDVVRDAHAVRRLIGLTGQYVALDENLHGQENLYLIARLLGQPPRDARARAAELLERFDLSDAARRAVKTYSGGMRRRLDLAASLVGRPRILFLDEPTTGLDPRSRLELWAIIRELVADGATVLLTTQYLDEADRLADTVTVLDRGTVIADGTKEDLKARTGRQVLEVRPSDPRRLPAAARIVAELTKADPAVDPVAGRLTMPVDDAALPAEALRRLDQAGITLTELAVRLPSLDEVYLTLTGSRAATPPPTEERIAI